MNETKFENRRHSSVFLSKALVRDSLFALNKSGSESREESETMRKSSSKPICVKLRSNSIFAYQCDDIYTNFCFDGEPEEVSGVLENSAHNSSNFFSSYGDKSKSSCGTIMFNFRPLLKVKNEKDEECCSISSEFERNLDFLEEVPSEEELNMAKLGSISNIKSNSNVTGNNSNSSGGKSATESEHYDEVDEYSFEKNEMEKLFNKRLSLGSNNQLSQFNTNPHLERLMRQKLSNRGRKDQKGLVGIDNDADDLTNSFDHSAASHQSHHSFQSQHSRHSSYQSNSPSQSPIKNTSFLFNSNNEIHNMNLNLRPNFQSTVNLPNLPQGNNYDKRRMSSNVFSHSTSNFLSPLKKIKNQALQSPAVFNLEINDINDVHVSGSIPNTVRDNSYMNTGRFTGISGPTAMTGNTRLTNLTGITGQTGYSNQSGIQLHQENNFFNTSGNNMNMNMMQMQGVGFGEVSQRNAQNNQGNFNRNINQNMHINLKMNNSVSHASTNKNLQMNTNNKYLLNGGINQMMTMNMSSIKHPQSQGGNFSGNNSFHNQNNSMSVHNSSYQGNITGNNSFQNGSLQSSFNNGAVNTSSNTLTSQFGQHAILHGECPSTKPIEYKHSNFNTSISKKNKNFSNLQKSNQQPGQTQFNTTSIPNFLQDDEYVLENIILLLKDQNGCRMVQKKIEEKLTDLDYISSFYEKISPYIYEIVNDQFGNYVIQKYFEIIQKDKAAVTRFFEKLALNLFSISVNPYGTRFLQRALECMTPIYSLIETEKLNDILKDLIESHIMDLILDTNGNHVFQKILALYPKDKSEFFYDELTRISFSVAKLKQGGCIFQKAFDHSSLEQKKKLVFEILKFTDLLINDEYGNFIIQQIVFLKNSEFNDKIFKYMKDNLGHLAKKKFSSNVIDKCILNDDHENNNRLRNQIIDNMIENRLICELICDQYGNYVVQKALQVTDGLKFMAIIHEIKASLKTLKQTSYGRKIYENLLMQYGDYFQSNNMKYKNPNDGRRNSHVNSFMFQYK